MDNKYNDVIVKKKWGFEYLSYQNEEVALWILYIKKGESTSLHCHGEKRTGLLCYKGGVRVNFLADHKDLEENGKVMIRDGLFHQTIAKEDSIVFEIERPNKKEDLVRLKDKYGRKNKAYEGKDSQIPKDSNCLWIENPAPNKNKIYYFENKEILVEHITKLEQLNNKNNNDLIMLLSGGFFKEIEDSSIVTTKAGDIGFYKIMRQVTEEMTGVLKDTIILTIKNEQ